MKEYKGKLLGTGLKIGIIVSRFNNFVTSKLLSGAIDTLERQGVNNSDIQVYWVPGAFEIPLTLKMVAQKKDLDGIICLSALIRGETSHFDFLSATVTKAINKISTSDNIPVSFGIITADTTEQAMNRAGLKNGNKGSESAMSLIEMINLKKEIE